MIIHSINIFIEVFHFSLSMTSIKTIWHIDMFRILFTYNIPSMRGIRCACICVLKENICQSTFLTHFDLSSFASPGGCKRARIKCYAQQRIDQRTITSFPNVKCVHRKQWFLSTPSLFSQSHIGYILVHILFLSHMNWCRFLKWYLEENTEVWRKCHWKIPSFNFSTKHIFGVFD